MRKGWCVFACMIHSVRTWTSSFRQEFYTPQVCYIQRHFPQFNQSCAFQVIGDRKSVGYTWGFWLIFLSIKSPEN